MRIYKAIAFYKHYQFALTILEFIDIYYLSKEKAKKLILEREQYNIDYFLPEY